MTLVTIKASAGVVSSTASVRLAADPRRTNVNNGPVWKYNLDAGIYAFNVDFFGIAPNKATFTFTNAITNSPAEFTIPGDAGTMNGDNHDIYFTV